MCLAMTTLFSIFHAIFLFFLCSTLNWQEHLPSDFYFLFHSKCMDFLKKFLLCVGVWFIDRTVLVLGVSQLGSSVTCPTLCDPMNHSMPGFSIHHQLPELAQTYVHQVSYAIQPPHRLSSPSPLAFNVSQHQGLFQWVSSLHQAAKVLVSASALVLPMNIQGWFPLVTCIQITAMVGFGSRADQFS